MWPYPWTHVGTPSHVGHMDRVAATMPSQAHAEASREAPDIGQWDGQDVPLVRASSCNVRRGIPSSRRYLPTYLVEEGATTQVNTGAVGNPSTAGPRLGAGEDLVHIPPGQGALDGGSQVKAVTWLVIAIPRITSFTSEEEATSALEELRLAEVRGKGEVNVEEKDVPKESGAHMEEQSKENVVWEDAPMVEDTACVKNDTTDEVVEEGAEETPSVKVEKEMKVESVEEANPDENRRRVSGCNAKVGTTLRVETMQRVGTMQQVARRQQVGTVTLSQCRVGALQAHQVLPCWCPRKGSNTCGIPNCSPARYGN